MKMSIDLNWKIVWQRERNQSLSLNEWIFHCRFNYLIVLQLTPSFEYRIQFYAISNRNHIDCANARKIFNKHENIFFPSMLWFLSALYVRNIKSVCFNSHICVAANVIFLSVFDFATPTHTFTLTLLLCIIHTYFYVLRSNHRNCHLPSLLQKIQSVAGRILVTVAVAVALMLILILLHAQLKFRYVIYLYALCVRYQLRTAYKSYCLYRTQTYLNQFMCRNTLLAARWYGLVFFCLSFFVFYAMLWSKYYPNK